MVMNEYSGNNKKEHQNKHKYIYRNHRTTLCLVVILMFFTTVASAHCDTIDGPVVLTAKMSLENGDVTPVLKSIKSEHEKEIR